MTLQPPAAPYRPRTLEWIAAGVMLSCGVILAMPGRTFDNSELYRAFSYIADESVWAAYCLMVGSFRGAALWINGSWRRSPVLRGITSVLGVCLWALIVGLIMQSTLPAPPIALAPFGGFLAIDLISAWRSGRDYIETERAHGRPI